MIQKFVDITFLSWKSIAENAAPLPVTLPTPESMTDAIAEPSSSLCSPVEGEIAEGGGEAPASALEAAAVPATLVLKYFMII